MPTNSAARLRSLLDEMVRRDASDLHLLVGYPPTLRIHGDLFALSEADLTPNDIVCLVRELAPPGVAARLHGATDLDFAAAVPQGDHTIRLRVNVFCGRGEPGACMRLIPARIPAVAELGFPEELADRIVRQANGLVLVTGITGAGKTTTLAALLNRLAARAGLRVITIEEPIEYVYPRHEGSLVTQREVGVDVPSFYDGLRFGLRQDPDVLLVGEIRDRDTAQLALSAAETGHLIFASLHTADAKGAITRLVDLFPTDVHNDVRTQLSLSLRYVVTQHLLPPPQRGGRRVLALEVLTANFSVRSAIRAGKIEALDTAIQSGRKDGMVSLDAYLRELVQQGKLDVATARQYAKDPTELGA